MNPPNAQYKNNYSNSQNNNDNRPSGTANRIAVLEKGRYLGTQFLSTRDEEILLSNLIEITNHLGEGYFSNVWRGKHKGGINI